MNENKFSNIALGIVVLFVGLIALHGFLPPAAAPQNTRPLLGSAVTAPLYNTVTNTSISCPSATSTTVLAAGSGRNYFGATNNDASNAIYICKAAQCSANTGLRLNAPGGAYEQKIATDGYTGVYSCIANSATSTLTITYSQ